MTNLSYQRALKTPFLIVIDLRDPISFQKHHFPKSINIPSHYILLNYQKLLRKELVYCFICDYGNTSKKISHFLNKQGYTTKTIKKGYNSIK